MSKHPVLAPVDPQLGQMPVASLRRVLADKAIAEIDDKTIVLADQAGKAIRQMHARQRTDRRENEPDKAEELAKEGRWMHDHPITFSGRGPSLGGQRLSCTNAFGLPRNLGSVLSPSLDRFSRTKA